MSRLRRVVRCATTLNSATAGTGTLSHVKLPDTASLLAVVPTNGYAETWAAVTRGFPRAAPRIRQDNEQMLMSTASPPTTDPHNGKRIGSSKMTALADFDVVSDAELAFAAAAGDRAAFAGIYDRYADRLHHYCVGIVRDHHAAADCVQDVFCIAAAELSKLRDRSKLRPWLYAIARNAALRTLREQRREPASAELPDKASIGPGPFTLTAQNELAQLVAAASGGLSDRDREVLELAYRRGLTGSDLAEALGVSDVSAKKLMQRLRETIERSLGALLVAQRAAQNGCRELAGTLSDWDGRFTILMRKRIARHIDSCPTCNADRRALVTSVAMLAGAFLKNLP
jgi:RNA polymerase sigma factor (sigma-70 family)